MLINYPRLTDVAKQSNDLFVNGDKVAERENEITAYSAVQMSSYCCEEETKEVFWLGTACETGYQEKFDLQEAHLV
jgi:hypothetical protein